MKLWNAIHKSIEQLRSGMFVAVIGRILAGAVQPKVGAEIDQDRGKLEEFIDAAGGRAVRQAQKQHVASRQRVR